ncbi:MAG: peptidylprolyl isomerase [Gemmatimonadaceae bacterium]|nr:peptidylprolyl isomerase [Gemmatimonadaceae bacterium]
MRHLLAFPLILVLAACAGSTASTPMPAPAVPTFQAGVVPDSFVLRLATTKGDIDVMLRRHWSPNGVGRVYEAAFANYYDGARFFRAIRGFVVQFGIAADPAVSASWRERRIPDDTVRESNRRGTLVFAAGGPDTRTTQLFFNLRDNARLDAMGFAPLGEIVAGLEVLDQLFTGYGDGSAAPRQDRLGAEGETYLAAEFPLLDKINSARVVRTFGPDAP